MENRYEKLVNRGREVNCVGFLASKLIMALFQLAELNQSKKNWWDEINIHSQFRQQDLEERAGNLSASCQDHNTSFWAGLSRTFILVLKKQKQNKTMPP